MLCHPDPKKQEYMLIIQEHTLGKRDGRSSLLPFGLIKISKRTASSKRTKHLTTNPTESSQQNDLLSVKSFLLDKLEFFKTSTANRRKAQQI